MAKLTAWIVTIIGVLMLLPLVGVTQYPVVISWLVCIGVLIIGVSKLMRNYGKKK